VKSSHHEGLETNWFCMACGAANEQGPITCFACHHPRVQEQDAEASAGLVADRYQLLSLVGTGGFSAVYRSLDRKTQRQVAVKQINLAGLSAQKQIEATETFHREVAVLLMLNHPQLPALLDYFGGAEHWYLVMEYMEGQTLEEYLLAPTRHHSPLTHNATLPADEVVRMGLQLCSVLDYLHTRTPPIIFRDLKPGNIIRASHGDYSLVDFGIARSFKPTQTRDTIPFGSPGYAAPEQYGTGQTSPRSDLYSLGVILHQALSGQDPSETPFQFAPLQYSDEALDRLAALVMHLVALQAENRPESARQVALELQAIQQVLKDHEQRIWRPTVGQTPPPTPLPPSSSSWYIPSSSRSAKPMQQMARPLRHGLSRRKVLVRGLAAGAALVGAGTAAKYFWPQPAHSPLLFETPWQTGIDEQYFIWGPDNTHITWLDDKGLSVADMESGQIETKQQGWQSGAVPQVMAWSADGKRLAYLTSHGPAILDIQSGEYLPESFQGQPYDPYESKLHWSPDGKYLACIFTKQLEDGSGISSDVQMWDARKGTLIYENKIQEKNTHYNADTFVTNMSWSPDSTRIALISQGGLLQVWNAVDGHVLWSSDAGIERASNSWVTWSPGGVTILAASGSGQTIFRLLDAQNGRILFNSAENVVMVGPCVGSVCAANDVSQAGRSVVWSPAGSRLALLLQTSDHAVLQIWDGRTGNALFICQHVEGSLINLSWSPNGRYLVAGNIVGNNNEHSTLQFWDARNGKALFSYSAPRSPMGLTWSADSRLLAIVTPKDWNCPNFLGFRRYGACMPENYYLQVYRVR